MLNTSWRFVAYFVAYFTHRDGAPYEITVMGCLPLSKSYTDIIFTFMQQHTEHTDSHTYLHTHISNRAPYYWRCLHRNTISHRPSLNQFPFSPKTPHPPPKNHPCVSCVLYPHAKHLMCGLLWVCAMSICTCTHTRTHSRRWFRISAYRTSKYLYTYRQTQTDTHRSHSRYIV